MRVRFRTATAVLPGLFLCRANDAGRFERHSAFRRLRRLLDACPILEVFSGFVFQGDPENRMACHAARKAPRRFRRPSRRMSPECVKLQWKTRFRRMRQEEGDRHAFRPYGRRRHRRRRPVRNIHGPRAFAERLGRKDRHRGKGPCHRRALLLQKQDRALCGLRAVPHHHRLFRRRRVFRRQTLPIVRSGRRPARADRLRTCAAHDRTRGRGVSELRCRHARGRHRRPPTK